MRPFLLAALLSILGSSAFAGNEGQKGGSGGKPNQSAQIKALEQQKQQLRAQEKTQLRQIESQFKMNIEALHKQKGALERTLKEKLEREKAQALKRIENRFAYIIKYDAPRQVWGQLDQAAKTLRRVRDHLKTANPDYGGHRVAAIRSLSRAVADLQDRLRTHHWLGGEREGTVKNLQRAEKDLRHALAYSAKRWASGTPKGLPEAQAASNKQLADGLTTIDHTRDLVLYAQWEEGVDKTWREGIRKREAREIHETKAAFNAKIKSVDKEVAQNIEQQKKQLEQNKRQAVKQVKANTVAAIKQIDAQINQLKKK